MCRLALTVCVHHGGGLDNRVIWISSGLLNCCSYIVGVSMCTLTNMRFSTTAPKSESAGGF